MLTHAHVHTAQHFDGTDDGDVADTYRFARVSLTALLIAALWLGALSPDGPGAGREGAD